MKPLTYPVSKVSGRSREYLQRVIPKVEITYGEHEVGVPVRGGLNNARAKNARILSFDLDSGLNKYIQRS